MIEDKSFFIDNGEKNSGDFLVLTSYWNESLRDIILEKGIYNLRLSRSAGWKDKDVSFLTTLPFLKGVEVYADDIRDLSALQDLELLEYIGLDCNLSFDLDLNNFVNLKVLQVKWNKHLKNMFNLSSIEYLNIIKYPYEDLVALHNYSNLKKLQLTSTKLKSLKGIDSLINLKSVDLFKCNQLESLESIDHLELLEDLEIENCKKIDNLYQLDNSVNLKTFLIEHCGNIHSLKPLQNSLNLTKVWIGGNTTVLDGDIEAVIKLPKIKELWFVNKNHYNIKLNEVQEILNNKY